MIISVEILYSDSQDYTVKPSLSSHLLIVLCPAWKYEWSLSIQGLTHFGAGRQVVRVFGPSVLCCCGGSVPTGP